MILSKSPAPPLLCNSGGYFHTAVLDDFIPAAHDPVGMYCSRKINGVRCLIHLHRDRAPVYYTKKGLEITGLDRITDALASSYQQIPECGVVIDGELSLSTPDGSDDFNSLVSEIQKKNHTIERAIYHAHDLIPAPQFGRGRWQQNYIDRRLYLSLLTDCADPAHFALLPQDRIDTRGQLDSHIARAVQMGWEGLVLRRNTPYSGQITEDVLRLKFWQDTEVPIVGYLSDANGITSIQVTLFGRALQFTRDQLPPGSLDHLTSPAQLLNSQATISWFDGKDISHPRIAAIYPGGRKF